MIFTSLPFAAFLVVVFTLHWLPLSRSKRHQNAILLAGSYFFYGWWDPRFLLLLLVSSLVDFLVGLRLHAAQDPRVRNRWLIASVVTNLSLLGFFKYFNFFLESLRLALGWNELPASLHIILPIGISFYTLQTLSYTIDIHQRRMAPTTNLLHFLTFVSFFPQLLAGPIERARSLLPQLAAPRVFDHDKAVEGCRQMLYGIFKKVVVADRMAPYVDAIFAQQDAFGGGINVLGLVLFSIQIYCDFSGYSDMAIGMAKLFRVDLMTNFDRPYFSTSMRELWTRWHISLSTWFRDYVYIPLGGNRGTRAQWARNLMLTFTLSGLWHGASFNFIFWGALHGAFYIVERLTKYEQLKWPTLLKWSGIMVPYLLARVFFRAEDMHHAWEYLSNMFSSSGAGLARLLSAANTTPVSFLATMVLAALLFGIDRLGMLPRWTSLFHGNALLRRSCYAMLLLMIALFGAFTDTRAFIYFHF
ncbi:MAG: MBOAT family protein [Flavobacteriales bacterium]|nr:MBOAT family protein [Flavobacteriales bacterium]